MTNVEALKNLYIAEGGSAADVADMTESSEVINAIAGYKAIDDIIVQADAAGTTYPWTDKTPADMQSDIVVADGAITGELKFISGGLCPSGYLSGDGNFLALKFIDSNNADSIKVGLVPSEGSGLVELDEDMNAVGKVTSTAQKFKVVTTKNGIEKTQVYDLSGLVLKNS